MQKATHTITMEALRKGLFARLAGMLTLIIFGFVFYIAPTGEAIAEVMSRDDQPSSELEAILENTPDKKLGHRLSRLREAVVNDLPWAMEQRRDRRGWLDRARERIMPADPLTASETKDLRRLGERIADAYHEAHDKFVEDARRWEQTDLEPHVRQLIRERHQEAMARFQSRHDALRRHLQTLVESKGETQRKAFDDLRTELEETPFERRHTPLDPDQLPWGPSDSQVREPITNPEEFEEILGILPRTAYPLLAASQLPIGLLAGTTLAAAPPVDADLAQTLEVRFTDEIQDLAADLDNDPTQIHAWVHNHIRYIPSHGSIQGAQATLESRSGNAMDTAGLLLSLLRAAGIPSRYAYGTVEAPAEKVMNWVGGAHTPEAAMNLMAQGGIPVTGITRGGQITHIRFEHVWAQAWVDYFPGRGMTHQSGDSWIPLDASFKQYDFTPGMQLEENVPFDAQALVDTIEQHATIDEAQGWIQNVPHQEIEQQLSHFQQQLEAYIDQQNPDATVGDVLGLQQIRIIPPRPLAAGLPYSHIATSQSFSEVPDSLRHKFRYALATLFYGEPDSTVLRIEQPTVNLAGKTLALSFRPATEADEAIIAARLPQHDPDTGLIDPARMPTSLPGYLIKMVAEFTIDGQVVAQGPAGTMGTELHETLGLWNPGDRWRTNVNFPAAGEYRAIGLDLQGASPGQAARLHDNIAHTRDILETMDDTQLATLTKHDVVGDLMYATIFGYFALNGVQDQIAAQTADMITYRLPSYGIFGTRIQTQYLYGVPRTISFGGLSMDVDHMANQTVSKSNDRQQWIAFNELTGARASAMEHQVPEMMFSTEDFPAHGISAVKALALAAEQGQRIWTITSENLDIALPSLRLAAETKTDIRNAVRAGKVVTAHEARINFHGWIGEGYTVIDPRTGAGAYMIAGGSNGGVLISPLVDLFSWLQNIDWWKVYDYASFFYTLLGAVIIAIGLTIFLTTTGVAVAVALPVAIVTAAFIGAAHLMLSMLSPVRRIIQGVIVYRYS